MQPAGPVLWPFPRPWRDTRSEAGFASFHSPLPPSFRLADPRQHRQYWSLIGQDIARTAKLQTSNRLTRSRWRAVQGLRNGYVPTCWDALSRPGSNPQLGSPAHCPTQRAQGPILTYTPGSRCWPYAGPWSPRSLHHRLSSPAPVLQSAPSLLPTARKGNGVSLPERPCWQTPFCCPSWPPRGAASGALASSGYNRSPGRLGAGSTCDVTEEERALGRDPPPLRS